MNRGLLFLLLCGLMVTSLGFSPLGQAIPARPEIRLDAAGQTLREPFAAYCWPVAQGNNQCDFVPTPTPVSTLQVPLGQAITILIDNSPGDPNALTVTVQNSEGIQGYNLPPGPQAIFADPLPLGENVLQVDATYDDVAGVRAFVSYIFSVFVYDETTGQGGPIAPDATALVTEEALPIPTEEVLPLATEEILLTEEAVSLPTEAVEVALATEEILPIPTEEVLPTEAVAALATEAVEVALATEEVLPAETEAVETIPTEEVLPAETEEVLSIATEEVEVIPTEEVEVTALTEAAEPSETPTEVPSATPTTPPSATPTELPSATPTTLPSATPTVVEAASEATAEATEDVEVIEALPADITPTITPTAEPVSLIPTQESTAQATATTVALVVQSTVTQSAPEQRPTSTTVALVAQPSATLDAASATSNAPAGSPSATPTNEPVGEPESAPAAQLVFAGRPYQSVGVSFCSVNESNQRICVDTPLESDTQAISLLQGFAAQIQLVESPRPSQIDVAFLNPTSLAVVQSETRPGDRLVLLNINAPLGEYIVRVNVIWENSTAQYFFRVRVN